MVIIAEGPLTPRNGRSDSRSITTPSMPEPIIVTPSAAISTPTSAQPDMSVSCPCTPKPCSTHIARKEPTMKTLKWEKLMSSRMP